MRSHAETVDEYLEELPDDRREIISKARDLVLAHLPEGYEENMNWGMISYEIPLERYPTTYNGQPLGYVALAAQKNYNALYLMGAYTDSEQEGILKKAYAAAGKKLNMGKSCLRFKKLDDLEMDAIGEVIAAMPVDEYIRVYEASRKS